jgi:hypothetical protein
MHKFTITRIYAYAIHGLITAIIVLIGMLVMKRNMPPKIVKIDLVSITAHYTQIMMKEAVDGSNANNPEVKKISETIKANLEPIISQYAQKNKVVVVQAQALVDTSTPDITDLIIEQLDRKLK